MQRPFRHSIVVTILAPFALVAIACTDEGVGDPCIPEAIPCDSAGKNCGYKASEAYLEASSVQCRSRLCLVYRLDNDSNNQFPSDPRELCSQNDNADGCLTNQQLLDSVYCTCRCGGGNGTDNCDCPSGYTCQPVLTQGGPGIVGDYCVKTATIKNE
jgi:hypothetical protein